MRPGQRVADRFELQREVRSMLEQAARITEARMRRSFLERVPEHARTMELAAEWLRDRA